MESDVFHTRKLIIAEEKDEPTGFQDIIDLNKIASCSSVQSSGVPPVGDSDLFGVPSVP